jgi:hypothetical protein
MDGTIRYGLSCTSSESREPANLQIALANKNWKGSMDDEYKALVDKKHGI